jgi:hypothetical protein
MILSIDSIFTFLAYTIFIFCIDRYVKRRRVLAAMPPGPPRIPILGNLLDIPKDAAHKTYAEWGRLYKSEAHA